MNFKKRVNGSWTDTPHYIYTTSTDTITTLPADLYADGNNATVGLVGNMQQTGTPTPGNPIQPSETGERTGNLFDRSKETVGYYINSSGEAIWVAGGSWSISDYIEIEENTQYTFNPNTTAGGSAKHCFYDSLKQPFTSYIVDSGEQTFTTPVGTKYARFSYRTNSENVILNTGSTALPYENFGYKIPISSAGQTTPVYLGEVQSTRQIKKLVLTGEEDWSRVSLSDGSAFYTNITPSAISTQSIDIYCTHYKASMVNDNYVIRIPNAANRILIFHKEIATITDFKSYLATQYAAGTPVTVWYVLATSTTGIVNEPLRKIGDYADTLSNVSIPVTAGGDTISVDTTLQPSEVTATYKGWHPVADVHKHDNGAWT